MHSQHRPTITVLYFAGASTATGLTTEEVELPLLPSSIAADKKESIAASGFPLSGLASLLTSRHPNTSLESVLERSSWAVDAEMVEDPAGVVLRGGEEVAVICPVSGG